MAITPQGRATRDEIVRTAMDAFADRGFRGASLDSIAQAVGVSRQGLLHYFPSKTDLLIAVLDLHEEDDRRFVLDVAERTDGALDEALIALVRRNHEQPGLAQLFTVLSAESVQPEHPAHERFRERYSRIRTELSAWIRQEQERGRITRAIESERLAVALIALLDGLHIQRLLEPEVDIIATLADVLALLGDAPHDRAASREPPDGDRAPTAPS